MVRKSETKYKQSWQFLVNRVVVDVYTTLQWDREVLLVQFI